jgi:transglutaminase-like putative cysteine protease
MRIRIAHETRYEYDLPAKSVLQVLRLTPREHDGQHVLTWHVELDGDYRLRASEDPLGNITHLFSAAGPLRRLVARVTGEVETHDTGGVVRGAVERFPAQVFLRDTPLTQPDAGLRAYASRFAGSADRSLGRLHDLLAAVNEDFIFDKDATRVATSASEAFALRRGVCQDLSQVFIVCARLMGIPCRYVSGHLAREDGAEQDAAHAWAEAYVDNLGWVGFAPANCVSPTESYVRVAIGLDYLGAAPVRGSRFGGGAERLDIRLRVTSAEQRQS